MSGKEEVQEIPEALVYYSQLEEIEEEFDEVDLEVTRYREKLSKDLYAKRRETISKIPNFWALVFEQAPEEEFENVFKPSDIDVLVSLKDLTVERFELPNGDPRNISIKFEFEENEYFEDKVLEKRFIRRQSPKGDFAAFVSEPVNIKWKEGKDLTNGLLDVVLKVHEEEKAGKPVDEESDLKKELLAKMEDTPMGGLSFFAWFGYRGPRITEEEHKEALKKEAEERKARKEGKQEDDKMDEDDEDDTDAIFEKAFEYEIYPAADDIAMCIAEEIWPDAIKLFLSSQDEDGLSELDFEELDDDDEDEDEEMEGADKKGDAPPNKKRKA